MTQYTKRKNRVQFSAYSQSSEPVNDNWYEKTSDNLGIDESGGSLIPGVPDVPDVPDVPVVPVSQVSNSQPSDPQLPIIETPVVTDKPIVSKPNIVKPETTAKRLTSDVNKRIETPVKKQNGTFTPQRLILLAILCVALFYGYKYIDKNKFKSSFGKYRYDISRAYDMVR